MARNSPVPVGGPDELTEMEAKLVDELLTTPVVVEAGRRAGFADRPCTEAALRREPVLKAIKSNRDRRLRTDLGNLALNTMKELMGKESPPAQRFAAAKWVLEAAGHGAAHVQPAGDKSISDMTTAELERFIKEAALAADPALAKRVIDHDALQDGALNPAGGQGGPQKP